MSNRKRERPPLDLQSVRRLTLDVPADLHKRIKLAAAHRGVNMCDVVKPLLEKEFEEPSNPARHK